LPGYGYAKVSKQIRATWRRLIEGYLTQNPNLIGLVLLLDCRRELTPEDLELAEWLAARRLPVLATLTKTDKLNRDKVRRKVAAVESQLGAEAIPFSAVTGRGKKELWSAVFHLVKQYYESMKT
jgi:GTP-binding protein